MARELRGMSQADLAEGLVSAAAISQYERGTATPSSDKLTQIARRLEVDVSFLNVQDSGASIPAYFRSLRSAPAGERKRARHNAQLVHQVAVELERQVRFPILDLPAHPIDERDDLITCETAAAAVRRAWDIPEGPVDDVVLSVEQHGVVVARLASGHERIDAFSVHFEDRPVIMMSAAKGKRDRSRFDVAHELGHLVMHNPGQRATKWAETQAHRFAAAFLMPEHDIREELPTHGGDWQRLMDLKRKWGVSIAALLFRAKALKALNDDEYLRSVKALSARGWRRHEPVDLGPPESPRLLASAMDLAAMDEHELSTRTSIPLTMLQDILDLATDDRPEVVL